MKDNIQRKNELIVVLNFCVRLSTLRWNCIFLREPQKCMCFWMRERNIHYRKKTCKLHRVTHSKQNKVFLSYRIILLNWKVIIADLGTSLPHFTRHLKVLFFIWLSKQFLKSFNVSSSFISWKITFPIERAKSLKMWWLLMPIMS